jgi:isopentenyl-diphosphate delta-isomerase
MKLEFVDVVDKNDEYLKTIDRMSATNSDILRVVGVFVLNNNNEILLQRRSEKSFRYPSHWDCSGGGHVDSGEDYTKCAQRELYEETGIDTKLEFLGKYYIELDDGRKHFIAFYKGKYNGEFHIDPNEVSRIEFFTTDEIKRMIKTGEKFHPECLFALKKYFY